MIVPATKYTGTMSFLSIPTHGKTSSTDYLDKASRKYPTTPRGLGLHKPLSKQAWKADALLRKNMGRPKEELLPVDSNLFFTKRELAALKRPPSKKKSAAAKPEPPRAPPPMESTYEDAASSSSDEGSDIEVVDE